MTSDAPQSARPPRPVSAVSHGVGLAGLAGVALWMSIAMHFGLDGGYSAMMNVLFCGVPMVLWSVLVDKVHRNPSTGIDWDSPPRPLSQSSDISLNKLAGLWATWALIAGLYCIFRFYWRGNYVFAMEMFSYGAVPLFLLSIPYVFWLDRRLVEPRDGAWHLGALLMGQSDFERDAIYIHLRAWAVKGFFLAFMVSIVPGGYQQVINTDFTQLGAAPLLLIQALITLMFTLDVAFATVGYLLTMKPLDAHIRSATPYAAGWAAALICYPPFILMGENAPLDYHPNGADWIYWFGDHPTLRLCVGALLVLLTAIYAWATIAFGLRFSNLTDRGIITHGPYAWTKHPAYVSKNLFWWLVSTPFLVTSNSLVDAVRNTAILAMVSGVYYWRARTEEKHLRPDPAYQAYEAWMAQHGVLTRWLTPANWRFLRRHPLFARAE